MRYRMLLFLLSGVFIYTKATCQCHNDSASIIVLWKKAVIADINKQLNWAESYSDSSFYKRILTNEKKNIENEDINESLRSSVWNKIVVSNPNFLSASQMCIVEHYRSGEVFVGEVAVFAGDDQTKYSLFVLELGEWKFKGVKSISNNFLISSTFALNDNSYFCDAYYMKASITVSSFKNKNVISKNFLFPCSKGYTEIWDNLLK